VTARETERKRERERERERERGREREEETDLQKLIQQINHASCPAILYEDIQVGTQDAKRAEWFKLMDYPVYVSVASLRTRLP
jgi:hypothetical protein